MITLESTSLRMKVDEDRGANIVELYSFIDPMNWFFYDPARKIGKGYHSVYDDVWCGGFEELFPNDAPCVFEGRELKDHGEFWNASWKTLHQTTSDVHLSYKCITVPAICEKKISLVQSKPQVIIDYSVFNTSSSELPYLFKLHPALTIENGDQILIPGGKILPVDFTFSKILGTSGPFNWPIVKDKNGRDFDLSGIQSENSKLQEFVYITELKEGWCGLRRKRNGAEIRFEFPLSVFPFCWIFITYGGWRNYYTVVVEPCTNFPKDLQQAKEQRTCAVLMPFEKKSFSISISIER